MALSVRDYLEKGPATSKEIQAATGLNQKAVSRQITSLGNSVIRFRAGRTYYYVVTRNAFGADDELPLFVVDTHGNTEIAATIRPLAHGGFFVHPRPGMPHLLLGENENGLYDDLPYFLADSAPQGFIGRQIAKDMSEQSDDFPSDPRHWNSNHIGCYLMSNGDDLPGNFKFGRQSGLRRRKKPYPVSRDDYPRMADEAMSGEVGGSSAGGEQPKFTAYCKERSAHVIVKFSPKDDSPASRRWRDILITEYHATTALHAATLPAAETMLFEKEGRLFLESIRFDRAGEYGRTSVISLQSVDAEFVGASSGSWPQVIDGLLKEELIGGFHAIDSKIIWLFGKFINNTDMHLGNLSLSIDGGVFRLCPVYDMCSMGFAPKSNGEVTPISFTEPSISVVGIDERHLSRARDIAHDFWNRVAEDERISDELKEFLSYGNPINLV